MLCCGVCVDAGDVALDLFIHTVHQQQQQQQLATDYFPIWNQEIHVADNVVGSRIRHLEHDVELRVRLRDGFR